MTTSSGKFVGIDVAKEKLDIAVLGEKKESQVTNDEKGIASLIKKMEELAPELIVVEATGGYQRGVVLGLYEAGLPVAVVEDSAGETICAPVGYWPRPTSWTPSTWQSLGSR